MKFFSRIVILLSVVELSLLFQNDQAYTVNEAIKEYILEDYDKDKAPVNEKGIGVNLYMHTIDIDEFTDKVSIPLYVYLTWNDSRLKWNRLEYQNLSVISIDFENIWIPELFPVSDVGAPAVEHSLHEKNKVVYRVNIHYSGHVNFLYSIVFETNCEIDLKDWPNDIHTCNIKFGSKPGSNYTIFGAMLQGPYNKILQGWIMKYNSPTVTYTGNDTNLYFHYTVESKIILTRRSSVYTGIYDIPIIIIISVILILLRLKPQNPHRIVIFGVIFSLECGIIQVLNHQVSSSGFTTPLIIEYVKKVLITTFLCILETIFLRVLLTFNSCPLWLYRFNVYISKIKILQNCVICNKTQSRLLESDEDESPQQAVASLNNSEMDKSRLLENTVIMLDSVLFYVVLVIFLYIIFLHYL